MELEHNRLNVKQNEAEEEKSTGAIWLERKSFRIALLSTFTALSVVLGYMLVYLPNIELFYEVPVVELSDKVEQARNYFQERLRTTNQMKDHYGLCSTYSNFVHLYSLTGEKKKVYK